MPEATMRMVMLTIQGPESDLTIEEVRDHYHLRPSEIDQRFGVVPIDPDQHLFTVRVASSAVARMQKDDWHVEGPFADIEIGALASQR